MPAIPMEDRSAPIVVGARHTSNAITLVMEIAEPAPTCLLTNSEYGSYVAVTIRKIMVNATSNI
jgi:hypothetical protein